MPGDNKKLEFIQMYTVKGLTPFELDVSIGRVYIRDFPSMGLYGDRNFLFYNKNGLGSALFEKSEMDKSTLSGEDYFSNPEKFNQYQKGVAEFLDQAKKFAQKYRQLDISKADYQTLVDLQIERNGLEEHAFGFYNASEPQVTSKIEEKVNFYLMKVIRGDKYNDYSSKLILSDKQNTLSQEEMEWLGLVKVGKKLGLSEISEATKGQFSDFYLQFEEHFQKYQQLTLGDDSWKVDITYFYNKYREDAKREVDNIDNRIEEIKAYPQKVAAEKQAIIDELKLDPQIVTLCQVLAEIGHLRLELRIDGWILLVYFSKLLDKEFEARLGISYEMLRSHSRDEYENLLKSSHEVDKASQDRSKINQSVAYSKDFLFWIDDGQIKILYGDEAEKQFNSLVQQEDLSNVTEVKGNTAMTGKVQGKVCIYNWGDNLEKKLEEMEENKILVAGMTRPQLMPLIYKSKAIVTDQGGVTCHAAIVSRELGIPCVIGTKNATKVFKPGEMVEVDANNGIVRKI